MINKTIIIGIFGMLFSILVLLKISKLKKLKKQDLKTAFLAMGFVGVISLLLLSIYSLLLIPFAIKLLFGILIIVGNIFLIKKFYKIDWKRAFEIYLLVILIAYGIIAIIIYLIKMIMVLAI